MTISLTTVDAIAEDSAATPGLWNSRFSSIVSNVDAINTVLPGSVVSTIAGTANQITVTQDGSVATLSLPSALTVPGNLAVTGWADVTSRLTAAGLASSSDLSATGDARIGGAIYGGSTGSFAGEVRAASMALTSALTVGSYVSSKATSTFQTIILEEDLGITKTMLAFGAARAQYFRKSAANTLTLTGASQSTFELQMVVKSSAAIETESRMVTATDGVSVGGFFLINSNGVSLRRGAGFLAGGWTLGRASAERWTIGHTSGGTTILNAASTETYVTERAGIRLHVHGPTAITGLFDFNGQAIYSIRTTADSPTSLTVNDGELVFHQPDKSGMTLAYRSNGVVCLFASSSTTVG